VIRLRKSKLPESLRKYAAQWTKELLSLLARNKKVPPELARRYNQPDVKDAATRDSFAKCIYCESKVLHVSFGDIEHMKPKKRFPELAYDWQNLGLVCTKCNNAKRDRYDDEVPPVNPYAEEPSDFLLPMGEWVWPRTGSDRGQETISLLTLNRAELIIERRRRMESIRLLAETLDRTRGDHARAALVDQLLREVDKSSEYCFTSRAVARVLGAVTDADLAELDSKHAA
jgi:5-methylcytosine-specific restriction endonuclease McrA